MYSVHTHTTHTIQMTTAKNLDLSIYGLSIEMYIKKKFQCDGEIQAENYMPMMTINKQHRHMFSSHTIPTTYKYI